MLISCIKFINNNSKLALIFKFMQNIGKYTQILISSKVKIKYYKIIIIKTTYIYLY